MGLLVSACQDVCELREKYLIRRTLRLLWLRRTDPVEQAKGLHQLVSLLQELEPDDAAWMAQEMVKLDVPLAVMDSLKRHGTYAAPVTTDGCRLLAVLVAEPTDTARQQCLQAGMLRGLNAIERAMVTEASSRRPDVVLAISELRAALRGVWRWRAAARRLCVPLVNLPPVRHQKESSIEKPSGDGATMPAAVPGAGETRLLQSDAPPAVIEALRAALPLTHSSHAVETEVARLRRLRLLSEQESATRRYRQQKEAVQERLGAAVSLGPQGIDVGGGGKGNGRGGSGSGGGDTRSSEEAAMLREKGVSGFAPGAEQMIGVEGAWNGWDHSDDDEGEGYGNDQEAAAWEEEDARVAAEEEGGDGGLPGEEPKSKYGVGSSRGGAAGQGDYGKRGSGEEGEDDLALELGVDDDEPLDDADRLILARAAGLTLGKDGAKSKLSAAQKKQAAKRRREIRRRRAARKAEEEGGGTQLAALRGGLALDLSRLETRKRTSELRREVAWEQLKADERRTARLLGFETELAPRILRAGNGAAAGVQEALAKRSLPAAQAITLGPAAYSSPHHRGQKARSRAPAASKDSRPQVSRLTSDALVLAGKRNDAMLTAALQCDAAFPAGGWRGGAAQMQFSSRQAPVAGPFSSGPALRAIPQAVCEWWWSRDAERRRRFPLQRSREGAVELMLEHPCPLPELELLLPMATHTLDVELLLLLLRYHRNHRRALRCVMATLATILGHGPPPDPRLFRGKSAKAVSSRDDEYASMAATRQAARRGESGWMQPELRPGSAGSGSSRPSSAEDKDRGDLGGQVQTARAQSPSGTRPASRAGIEYDAKAKDKQQGGDSESKRRTSGNQDPDSKAGDDYPPKKSTIYLLLGLAGDEALNEYHARTPAAVPNAVSPGTPAAIAGTGAGAAGSGSPSRGPIAGRHRRPFGDGSEATFGPQTRTTTSSYGGRAASPQAHRAGTPLTGVGTSPHEGTQSRRAGEAPPGASLTAGIPLEELQPPDDPLQPHSCCAPVNCSPVSLLDLEVAELPSIVFLLLRGARRYPDDVDIVQSVARCVGALARSAPLSGELGTQGAVTLMSELIARDVPTSLPRETQQACLFAISELCRLGSNAQLLRMLGESQQDVAKAAASDAGSDLSRGADIMDGKSDGPSVQSKQSRRTDAATKAAGLLRGTVQRGPLSLPQGATRVSSLAEARALLSGAAPSGGLTFLREVSTRGDGESRDRDRVVRRLPVHVREAMRQRLLRLSAMRSWVLVSLGYQNRHRIEGVGKGDTQAILLEPARSAGLASAAEEAGEAYGGTIGGSGAGADKGHASDGPAPTPPGSAGSLRPSTSTRLRGRLPGLGDDPMQGIATGADALRAVGGPGELPPCDPLSLLSTGGHDDRLALPPGCLRPAMAQHGHDVDPRVSARLVGLALRTRENAMGGVTSASGWRDAGAAAAAAIASSAAESSGDAAAGGEGEEDVLAPIRVAINTTVNAPRTIWQRMGLSVQGKGMGHEQDREFGTGKPELLTCNTLLLGGEQWLARMLRGFTDGAWPEFQPGAMTKEGVSLGAVMALGSRGSSDRHSYAAVQEIIRSPELVGDGHIVREGVPRGYLPLDMRELGPADAGDGGSGGSAGRGGAAGRVAPSSGYGKSGNVTGSSSSIYGSTSGRVSVKKKKKKQQGGSSANSKRGSNNNPILRAIAEEKRGRGKEDQEGFQGYLAPGAVDLEGAQAAGVDSAPTEGGDGGHEESASGAGARPGGRVVPPSKKGRPPASAWLDARGPYEDALERRLLAMYQQEASTGTFASCPPRPLGQGWHALLTQRPPGLPPPPPLVLPERLRAMLWDWEDHEAHREEAARVLRMAEARQAREAKERESEFGGVDGAWA